MKLDLTDMLYALSFALDKVEVELLGVATGHGRRVTYLAALLGKEAGLAQEELRDFVGCCLLHDNALTEFIHEGHANDSRLLTGRHPGLDERQKVKLNRDHSIAGEQNIRMLPFRTDVKDIILYHHENADGTGALGRTAAETPMKAQILHLADQLDTTSHIALEDMTDAQFEALCAWVRGETGKLFSGEVVELFFRAVSYDKISRLGEEALLAFLHREFPEEILEYSDAEIRSIAGMFAKIVDYKSEFTQHHSTGVAQKAELMARYYGFDAEKAIRFYFAGAMHDIGKMAVVNDILEKPGKLTEREYAEMKNHAAATYHILSRIKGIPDIVEWASNHHEKLNGRGYPRGLSSKELCLEDQLMACVDIYQALTEKRPYKAGMPHERAISLMQNMAGNGELNASIVRDIDIVLAGAN